MVVYKSTHKLHKKHPETNETLPKTAKELPKDNEKDNRDPPPYVDERHQSILTADSYEEISTALSYYLEHKTMYTVPDVETSPKQTFWAIMFSLQECSKAEVIGSRISISFADLHVGFSLPVLTIRRSMQCLNAFSPETFESIICRRQIEDSVKMLILETASKLKSDDQIFTPSKIFELSLKAYRLNKSYFAFIVSYLTHENQPDWNSLDENICLKLRSAYNDGDLHKFRTLLTSPIDADDLYFVWSCLSVLGHKKAIAHYLVVTRDFELASRLFIYVSNKFTRRRISRLLKQDIDLNQFVSSTVSWFFFKKLAPTRDVIHFIDLVIYQDVGLPDDMRVMAYCHCAIGLYERSLSEDDYTHIEQAFNALTACKEEEIMLAIKEALVEHPLYDFFDNFLMGLLKKPYEQRMKFIKGHVLLLLREKTVQSILENKEKFNMSPLDANSLPNLLARTHMLIGSDSSTKLIETTSAIGRITQS